MEKEGRGAMKEEDDGVEVANGGRFYSWRQAE